MGAIQLQGVVHKGEQMKHLYIKFMRYILFDDCWSLLQFLNNENRTNPQPKVRGIKPRKTSSEVFYKNDYK